MASEEEYEEEIVEEEEVYLFTLIHWKSDSNAPLYYFTLPLE